MGPLRRVLVFVSLAVAVLLVSGGMSQKDLSAILKGPYTLQVDYSSSHRDALAEVDSHGSTTG